MKLSLSELDSINNKIVKLIQKEHQLFKKLNSADRNTSVAPILQEIKECQNELKIYEDKRSNHYKELLNEAKQFKQVANVTIHKLSRSRSSVSRIIATVEKRQVAFTGLPINTIKTILVNSGEFSTVTVDHVDESTTDFVARSNTDKATLEFDDLLKLVKISKSKGYAFNVVVESLKVLRLSFTEGFDR